VTVVDIIIPTLDRRVELERALDSVAALTGPPVQVTVVDQGSTDGTVEMLTSRQTRWIVEPIRGAGAARRAGLQITSADYVLFLDNDDWLVPDAVETLRGHMDVSSADIVFGQAQPVDTTGDRNEPRPLLPPAPLTSATLLRRSCFERFGEFENSNYSFPRWIISARAQGLVESSTDSLVCYRGLHDGNVTRAPGAHRHLFDMVRHHRRLAEEA
jgi:glycosyltransferase involved in cell wall biosynthesis